MAMKLLANIWIRRQQCPCGDWNCYISCEGEDQASINAEVVKSETVPSQLSLDSVFTPYVGQIFKSDDDAFEYYSNFARKDGFSIRKDRSTKSQSIGVYRRDIVCYRSGYNQPRKKVNVEHPRERKSVRCGCDAKLYLTKEIVDGVSQWYVSQFSNVHNHELLEDDLVRLLPAYRKIQKADQERILILSKAGFPVNRILKVLELEKGVQPGQLPFIEKDVRNFVRTSKKTVDENDALLNEKRENQLLELLEICKVIIPLPLGYSLEFGLARTISERQLYKLRPLHEDNPHSFSWAVPFDLLWHLENIADFEHQWGPMVAQFGLASDKHIALLYLDRASWPFSFIRSSFLARTLTVDFFKSLEVFLKIILSAQTCLKIFFEQVSNAANSGIQAKEGMQYLHIKTCMPIEQHAQSILTPYAFSVLQNEIVLSMQYVATEMGNGSYLLQHYKKMDVERLVSWTQEDDKSEACAQAFHSPAATLLTESLMSHERFNYVHRELSGLLEHVRSMPVVDEFSLNTMTGNKGPLEEVDQMLLKLSTPPHSQSSFVSAAPFVAGVADETGISNDEDKEAIAEQEHAFWTNPISNFKESELSGNFPQRIFHLPNLQHLILPYNPNLSGTFPEFNFNSSLRRTWFEESSFHGEVPSSFENLKSLTYLKLGNCSFSGIVPDSLGNITGLHELELHLNDGSGRIPLSLERLTELNRLFLSYNEFGNATLSWVGKQNKLVFLGLSRIGLSGTLMPSLGNLTKIEQLLLGENGLTGDSILDRKICTVN
ncbi:hypothetical protein Csa_020193 [Cucumis sativus]|nr:hypothetical protein Csa_020193 [Cucumis sativus]